MIAEISVITTTNADLVVKRSGVIIPHFFQPVGAEFSLTSDIGRTTGESSGLLFHREVHEGIDITGGLDEFKIVASIEPATRNIDRTADLFESTEEGIITIGTVTGGTVDCGCF